jgi:uncharacterized membrane protein YfcA
LVPIEAGEVQPGTAGQLVAGGVIGFLSGMVGAGGRIRLHLAGVIALCSAMTAPVGARAALNIPVGKLKPVSSIVLYLLAAYMLYKGLNA